MIRLFVALGLPDDVRHALSNLGNGVPGARWSQAQNYHLTLRFVGNVDGHVADDVHDALSGIQADGFDLRLKGLSWFGTQKRPSAIVACAEKTPALLHLHQKVESAVARAGLGPDDRKFMPHVTLARLKGATVPSVQRYCAERADFQTQPFFVDRFTLYSSFLSQSGAIYTPEADYPLRDFGADVWSDEDEADALEEAPDNAHGSLAIAPAE